MRIMHHAPLAELPRVHPSTQMLIFFSFYLFHAPGELRQARAGWPLLPHDCCCCPYERRLCPAVPHSLPLWPLASYLLTSQSQR